MKRQLCTILITLAIAMNTAGQTTISGKIIGESGPLAGANIFLLGSTEGCLSDSLGCFSFVTTQTGKTTLRCTYMGYDDVTMAYDIDNMTDIVVKMRERAANIDEVVVTASTFHFGKSDHIKTMSALDVVMTGNSCGDLVAALQALPGTQKVGENGKLYVRGGDSDECQTFINGMHVLVPYSTHSANNAVRGRFSPFLFKGISFSLGGYNGEYGQALSSVLPMETTDAATNDKLGVNVSLVDWNLGGTKAFKESSLSFNADYTSMGVYNRLFPDRYDWARPYRKLSGEVQYKTGLSSRSMVKSYIGYDYTTLAQHIDNRRLSLSEHNFYGNVTLKTNIGNGFSLFSGIANSSVRNDIDNALRANDHLGQFRNEIHLKAEIRKVFSPKLKLSTGVEDYIRHSRLRYDDSRYRLNYNIVGMHIDAQYRISRHIFLQLSSRAEQTSHNGRWMWMPRTTLTYVANKRFQISAQAGSYGQVPNDDCLATNPKGLGQSKSNHAILCLQYTTPNTLMRLEPYIKEYKDLPLLIDGIYQPNGYGTSRGFDLFIEDHSLSKRLSTMLSYSYNDSERLYMDYTSPCVPDYVSRHNLRASAKYAMGKSILGLSYSYTSGRHFTAGVTPDYHSLDANLTYLLSPRVIIYTSLSNLLGRTNVFRYNADGSAVKASCDRFFYIGIIISLKNNKAYDISNF